MSEAAETAFVRQELVPERAAPVRTTGFVGFLRTRLFNSPTNILLTVLSALLLWFTVVPLIRFLLVDAVWTGTDRNACLAENAGHPVGACWPYIEAKFTQFIYGFYPERERWRVNLTFILAVLLLVPLLIPRLPGKGLNAALFFIAFPVIGFFLLHGGGVVGYSASAVIVSALLFLLGGGIRTGWRALAISLACFAGVGVVVAAMGLDHGELPVVDTRLWGGLLVTLVVSVTGIVTSMRSASRWPWAGARLFR